MSGGSFDYLFTKEFEDLAARPYVLKEMVEALVVYGTPEAKAAAKETQKLIVLFETWDAITTAYLETLRPVWKAVEWHHSSDKGVDHVLKELEEYAKEAHRVENN